MDMEEVHSSNYVGVAMEDAKVCMIRTSNLIQPNGYLIRPEWDRFYLTLLKCRVGMGYR